VRFSDRYVFPNIDKPDLPKLIAGKAFVSQHGYYKPLKNGGEKNGGEAPQIFSHSEMDWETDPPEF
tara:strand:+ start:113 stop:310 length:198 start_codon:yes stop_codon:yes gene_type:complete